MIKKLLTACLFTTVLSISAHAENVSIGGNYKVEGTNINGTTYSGDATISLTSETTCEIH